MELDPQLNIRQQCELIHKHRSTLYYRPVSEPLINHNLLRLIDKYHIEDQATGTRCMGKHLRRETCMNVGRKPVRLLMGQIEIEEIVPRKETTIPDRTSEI